MNGITTVRDIRGFPGIVIKFKEKADNNKIPGPRVVSSLSMIAAKRVYNWDGLGELLILKIQYSNGYSVVILLNDRRLLKKSMKYVKKW